MKVYREYMVPIILFYMMYVYVSLVHKLDRLDLGQI